MWLGSGVVTVVFVTNRQSDRQQTTDSFVSWQNLRWQLHVASRPAGAGTALLRSSWIVMCHSSATLHKTHQTLLQVLHQMVLGQFNYLVPSNAVSISVGLLKSILYPAITDSVDRCSLWLLLPAKGIPVKLLDLLEDLYGSTLSCVCTKGELSPWFEVSSGVRQGCIVAPELFLYPEDTLTSLSVKKVISNPDFADDVLLLSSMLEILVLALEILHKESSLEINWPKTKLQAFNDAISPPFVASVLCYDAEVVDSFI